MFDATITATFSKTDLPEELPSMTTGLLTGVIEETQAPLGTYIMEPDATEAEFVRVADDEAFVEPFHCFMTVSDSDAETYKIDTQITGISKILNGEENVEIYDIDGRRLENLQKGINIVNGIKVIVK